MRRSAALAALVLAALVWAAPPASAHPLGNFTVNRYAGIVLRPDAVRVHYVLDLAEVPTFQEEPAIDGDGDGVDHDELTIWADRTATSIAGGLQLEIDATPVALSVEDASAALLPGQGGLSTLRLEITMASGIEVNDGVIAFHDMNEPDRLGWREITASAEGGLMLASSSVPVASVSEKLRSYPNDLLSSPLGVTTMRASFEPGSAASGGERPASANGTERPLSEGGPFAALLVDRGMPLAFLGLLAAMASGAWHALLPGHGKTLVAAAMVGSHARIRHAATAGVAVAVMHTISVIGLGVLVLFLERTFRPEALYPWLGAASGLAAIAIGAHLLRSRIHGWRHDHDHDHVHADVQPTHGFLSGRGIAALAFAGGILPAPSALLVMLAAIQAHRAAYGLGLVLAFSVGLATALTIVGMGAMRIRDLAAGRLSATAARLIPLASGAAIVVVGLYVIVRSVSAA